MTITTTKRRFFGAERFAEGNLKVGETFSVDSSMGEGWTIAYVRHLNGGPVFRNVSKTGWVPDCIHYLNDAEAARHVFILIPGTTK